MSKFIWAFSLYFLSLPCFAIQFLDGKSFIYDIGQDSALIQGSFNAYQTMYRLRVNKTNYVGKVVGLSTGGRQSWSSVFTEPSTGLEIERRVYVPKTNHFARFMEIIRNPTDSEQIANIEIFGTLGSGNNTQLIDNQSTFLITTDNRSDSQAPILLHYHSQVGNTIKATHQLDNGQLSWTYPAITIPAQATVRIIYFVAQASDTKSVYEAANFIFNNPTALYESLGTLAVTQIINFKPTNPIASQDFSAVTFLNLNEVRIGTLTTEDNFSHARATTPADAYAVNLEAGKAVTIEMAAFFNAYVYLFADVNGKQIVASNDDSGIHTQNAAFTFTPETSGTYYIETTAHNPNERGQYSLVVNEGATNFAPEAYPFEVTMAQLTAPATVNFIDFSVDTDGEITERCWQFGDGSSRSCGNFAEVSHTYNQPGHYSVTLTLKDNNNAWSTYSEEIKVAATDDAVILPVSNSVTGELASSDTKSLTRSSAYTDRYLINTVTIGEELVIDMHSSAFDSYLYLYDQYHRLLRKDDNSGTDNDARLRYMPTNTEPLLVEATSFNDNQLGSYTLSLNKAINASKMDLPLEAISSASQPLQTLFIARLPENFKPTLLTWDFGDGQVKSGTSDATASHIYAMAGNYNVSLTVLNAQGEKMTGNQSFYISRTVNPPFAKFRATPLYGEIPLRVFFTNESVTNLAGDSMRYVWQFGNGELSTDTNPAYTFTQEGMYNVILQAYSNTVHQSASYSIPIAIINRETAKIPVINTARERPQIIMAGFDPILVDLSDTDVKLFAIVRPGQQAIKTVQVTRNDTDFQLVMQHTATYANGDQRYEAVYTFEKGIFPVISYDYLLGDSSGQLKIQAIDQSGQFHSFPNLEIGENPVLTTLPTSLQIESVRQMGIHRRQPQVLAAGFDPALVDIQDTEFQVKAIVRAGLYPIKSVTLKQNQGMFSLLMHRVEILPNGDQLYAATYTYSEGFLPKGTFGSLFGGKTLEQMVVEVIDRQGQSHRFPELKVGNYPKQ